MDSPRLIEGGAAVDERGRVAFVNGFDFEGVKRCYLVSNHTRGFIRAWQGHRKEAKYIMAVQGAARVCAVAVDDWQQPSKSARIHDYTLSAEKPAVLFVPAGYANGWMSLTEDARVMFFSTATLDESKGDDFRFDSRYWDPWESR